MCSSAWRWRSPTSSPACTIAATWRAISTIWSRRAGRTGKPLAFLILDIDYFKSVNDGHGHDIGDEVLKEFANRIAANVRGIDLACRYGGEEFVVVMPDTDMALAFSIAERLRKSIETTPIVISRAPGKLNITISIGIAGSRRRGRHRRSAAAPRRPGALQRQAQRPQPRRDGGGGLSRSFLLFFSGAQGRPWRPP